MKASRTLTTVVVLTLMAATIQTIAPVGADTGSRSAADVTVADISLSQAMFFVGDIFTITATIANLGTENATDVTVSFEAGNLTLPPIDLGTNASIGSDNGGTDVTNVTPIEVSVEWNTSEPGKQVQTGKVYSINVTATNSTDGNTTNDVTRLAIQFLDDHYLSITDVTPSATAVKKGTPLNISWEVTNIGSKAIPALGDTLYIYQDDDLVALDTTSIMNLGPKESKAGTFDIDTSDLTIGNHTYRLELFNSKRNVTTDNITITYPNLFVGEVTWAIKGMNMTNVTNATVGDILLINATINNNGSADAVDVHIGYFVDGSPIELYNDTVNVTSGGTNVSMIEWNTTGLTALNHTITASLKPTWDSENSTGNITFLAGGVADLAITKLEHDPAVVDIGDIVNITATVKNVGDWPSEATNVSFRFVKGLNSTNLGLVDIGPLAPGQSTSVWMLWNTSGLEWWNYQIWAQVDPEGYVYEEVLTNNKANVSLVLNAKPDLTISSINMTVSQAEVTNISQGEKATINIVVTNIGTKNSLTTRASIYLDQGTTPLDTMKIFGLAVDGEYVLQYLWDTKDVTVGDHTFKVAVDTDDNNTEILEDNNELTFAVKVLEPKGAPDMVIDSISIDPASPKVGDHVELTATLKNIGTADAVNVTLLFAYEAPGGNIEIGKEVVPLVSAGQEVIKAVIWTTGTLTAGDYVLNISADPLNEIMEHNRANNFKTLTLSLAPSGAAAGFPDMKVVDIVLDPAKPKAGKDVTVTIIVKNDGTADASDIRVVFYVDGVEEVTKTMASVPKGGTAQTDIEWKAKKGMHELKAEVYIGTSAVKDDQRSEVFTIKSLEDEAGGDYLPILVVIIVMIILAIVLMAAGGKGGKDKKGFIEEDHDEDEEDDEEE